MFCKKIIFFLFALLFSTTSVLAQGSGNINPFFSGNDEGAMDAPNLPSTDEYANVPEGLMLAPESKQETPSPENTSGQSGTLVDTVKVLLTMDAIQKLYGEKRYQETVQALDPLVKGGHHGAEELMGIMYRAGTGVTQDKKKAFDLLQKAASANMPLAQHHLGTMYFSGEGVAPDSVQALVWLNLAILHYQSGPEKLRASQDRDNIFVSINRRDRERAKELTRQWLDSHGEGHLLSME